MRTNTKPAIPAAQTTIKTHRGRRYNASIGGRGGIGRSLPSNGNRREAFYRNLQALRRFHRAEHFHVTRFKAIHILSKHVHGGKVVCRCVHTLRVRQCNRHACFGELLGRQSVPRLIVLANRVMYVIHNGIGSICALCAGQQLFRHLFRCIKPNRFQAVGNIGKGLFHIQTACHSRKIQIR